MAFEGWKEKLFVPMIFVVKDDGIEKSNELVLPTILAAVVVLGIGEVETDVAGEVLVGNEKTNPTLCIRISGTSWRNHKRGRCFPEARKLESVRICRPSSFLESFSSISSTEAKSFATSNGCFRPNNRVVLDVHIHLESKLKMSYHPPSTKFGTLTETGLKGGLPVPPPKVDCCRGGNKNFFVISSFD